MHAVVMIVADILSEQTLQMAFVDCNDVIQQVAPAAFNTTLRNSILPRTPQRSADTFDFHRSDRGGDFRPILGITIEEDEPQGRPKWKRFPELLDDPTARRVLRDVDVQDAAMIMTDDEEAVEHAERDRRDREEIHCSDDFPVVAQKGKPAPGRLGISRRSAHPARDYSLRDIKTEHEEFAMDPRGVPRWILGNHLEG